MAGGRRLSLFEARPRACLVSTRACREDQRGQSLVEFALVVPLMLILAIAIADFGRVFTAEVAIESAAREGADYGAFLGSSAWASAASPWTANDIEIRRRACAAAAQLSGFDNSAGTCSQNPTVSWELLDWNRVTNTYTPIDPATMECDGRTGLVDPCVVRVTVSYTFSPLAPILPIPSSFLIQRDSYFAISDLAT